jgi:hypothetical protein
LRKKTIDITAEDAKFDLNMVRLVLGSKLREGVTGDTYKFVSETATVGAGGEITLSQPSIASPAPTVRKDTATGLLVTATHNVGANTLTITAGAADGDTVFITYAIATVADVDGYVWVLEEKHTVKNGKITLGFGSTLFSDNGNKTKHISVRALKDNKLIKQVSAAPAELEYMVDALNGEITFNSNMEGVDVYANYKRTEVVDVLAISTKDFPLTVSVVHDGLFEQKDGSLQGYQTELYSCRVKSNFTLDAQRQQASTHSVTLTVIDGERVDSQLGTIKRYEVLNSNLSDIC